jgi:hypothetical protein
MLMPPATPGPGVCRLCRNLIAADYDRCFRCARQPQLLDAVAPIAYSIGGRDWHRTLRRYKDAPSAAERCSLSHQVASVLERFLLHYEACVAGAAGVDRFDIVTTVPSSSPLRDSRPGGLRWVVGGLCRPTASRFRRVLVPAGQPPARRRFDGGRYAPRMRVDRRSVLLVDDVWTTGAAAQSAAWALRHAGASAVALVVLGRHVNPEHPDVGPRLSRLPSTTEP